MSDSNAKPGHVPQPMWVLYDHPKDDPEAYVARKWTFVRGEYRPSLIIMRDHDLERLRGVLRERGLYQLSRMEGDDPVIVECWL